MREGRAGVTLLLLSVRVALLSVLRLLGSLWSTLVPACSTVAALHGCAPGRGGVAGEQGMDAASRALVGVHLPVALGPSSSSECVAGIVVLVIFNFLMALLAAALLAVHFKPWFFCPQL